MKNTENFNVVVDVKDLQTELEHKQHRIDSLLEITQAINRNFTVQELFTIFTYSLKAQFNYSNIFIIFKKGDVWHYSFNGDEGVLVELELVEFLSPFTSLSYLEEDEAVLGEYDVVVPVVHKEQPLAYILIEGVHNSVVGSLDEEIRFLQTITNVTVMAAENKRLFKEQIQKELEQKDLSLAAEVQQALVPQDFPKYENCDFAAVYEPHSGIGGDYYDVIPHPTENSFYVAIADVSGKGVSAALIMASFQATLRSVIRTDLPFKKFAQHLNNETFRITNGEKFITLFVAKINLEKHIIQYWNAGHNPSILKRDDSLTLLTEGSTLLGAFPQLPTIVMGTEELGKRNTLFTYTDGLTDLINDANERFQLEGLLEFMSENEFSSAEALNSELRKRLEKYKGRNDFDDDITLLTTMVK